MVFGKRELFAIETSVLERTEGWIFGVFLFWIRGLCIGNPTDHADLRGCLHWLRDLVDHPRDRFENLLRDLPVKEVFKMLHGSVMPGAVGAPAISDAFSRFHITHVGMSSFDRFDVLLIEDPDRGQRIIWREGDQVEPLHAYLPAGHIQEVARECVTWMAKEIEMNE